MPRVSQKSQHSPSISGDLRRQTPDGLRLGCEGQIVRRLGQVYELLQEGPSSDSGQQDESEFGGANRRASVEEVLRRRRVRPASSRSRDYREKDRVVRVMTVQDFYSMVYWGGMIAKRDALGHQTDSFPQKVQESTLDAVRS